MARTLTYAKHVSFKNFSSFTYVVNELDEQAYLLEGTAALIWKEIGNGGSVLDVYNRSHNAVSELGDTNYVLAQEDFASFCRSMLLSGLIEELVL